MATHFRTLAWRIPWTEESGRLQSTDSQRVRHDLATKHAHMPVALCLWNRMYVCMCVCVCVCVCVLTWGSGLGNEKNATPNFYKDSQNKSGRHVQFHFDLVILPWRKQSIQRNCDLVKVTVTAEGLQVRASGFWSVENLICIHLFARYWYYIDRKASYISHKNKEKNHLKEACHLERNVLIIVC